MKAIFDFSLFTISDTDWRNPEQRDNFLQTLLDHLEVINEYTITKISICDELEEKIWSENTCSPWLVDRFKLPMCQTLFRYWNKCVIHLPNVSDEVCNIRPSCLSTYGNVDVKEFFFKIAHALLMTEESFYFCINDDSFIESSEICFYCNCHEKEIMPVVIKKKVDWLGQIDLKYCYWPNCCNDQESDKFKKGIDLALKILFAKEPSYTQVYLYEMDRNFISDIISERDDSLRGKIFNKIAMRLSFNQRQASDDRRLNDEPVVGQSGIRRFRVSNVARIHYSYSDDGKIKFNNYYGPGRHDDGL